MVVKRTSLVEVPSLKGKTLTDAQKALRDSNLAVGQITREPNSSVAPDAILSEFPGAGKQVDPGTAIDLVVAQAAAVASAAPPASARSAAPAAPQPPKGSGPVQRTVPDLTGSSLPDALAKLQGASLVVGKISRQPNSSVAPDTVLSEFPTANSKVASATAIDLVVAQAQTKVASGTIVSKSVPNFAGTWELVTITMNGMPEVVNPKSKHLVITQNGTTVNLSGRELQITPAGTFGYQLFFAHDDKYGHEVATAAQADLVDTVTYRLEAGRLVGETVSDYRHPYSNHPPGRDLRITSHSRIAP